MKIEDKLTYFLKMANEEAEAERARILAEFDQRMNEYIGSVTDDAQKKADALLRSETAKIEQSKNKEINLASTESKKEILNVRGLLLDDLFDGAINKIREYTQTDAYRARLLKDISESSANYGKVRVYLMEGDFSLSGELPANCECARVKDDFIGGFKLLLTERNAIEDHTYLARLKTVRDDFNELRLGNGKEAGQ